MSVSVSVIIPNRNMGAFLPYALRSIARQDKQGIEVIVADAGSDDDSVACRGEGAALGFELNWLDLGRPVTPAMARNRALAEARGDFIAFLDADDLWPIGKLERQLGFLASHPQAVMVSGRVRYFDLVGADGLAPAVDAHVSDLVHVHVGASIWRRSMLIELGGFDESFTFSEDVDLMLRLRESGSSFGILQSIELYYRQHPHSMMASADPARERDFHRAALCSIRRRRAAGRIAAHLPPLESFLVS